MTPILILGLVLVIAGLAAVVLLTTLGAEEPTGVAKSLTLIQAGNVSSAEVARHNLGASDRFLAPLLNAGKGLGRRLTPNGAAERIARSLDRAGNPPAWTVERIFGAKGIGLVVGVVLGLLLGGIGVRGVLYAAALGAFLFWLPDLLVYNASLRRQEELRRGLANALDMLTVCVEAGLGFDAALLQVARSTTGPIAGELARVLSEIQIGRTRSESFAAMGTRTNAPEVKNFISALVQADRLGLPIGGVLREQASNMRLVRRQQAEEKAQKVTVKILFPLLLCIFPALFIVIIGPGVIRIISVFSHLGG